ncbi:hypothetical protein PR048_017856 [Dryococelus australis]|uniref:Uncharacterized protein n=1 Tax=Dryococelus australis TaxID=614101 RepID=A0ABQ9HAS9_9NEOP|nr:hypothetical protein PR048_017856 [Dryococelus australis]
MSAYIRKKAKSKYGNCTRLERTSQKQSSDTHKIPYYRVKRRREVELAAAMLPDLPVFDCRPCVGGTSLPRSGRVAWCVQSAVLARTCTHRVELRRYQEFLLMMNFPRLCNSFIDDHLPDVRAHSCPLMPTRILPRKRKESDLRFRGIPHSPNLGILFPRQFFASQKRSSAATHPKSKRFVFPGMNSLFSIPSDQPPTCSYITRTAVCPLASKVSGVASKFYTGLNSVFLRSLGRGWWFLVEGGKRGRRNCSWGRSEQLRPSRGNFARQQLSFPWEGGVGLVDILARGCSGKVRVGAGSCRIVAVQLAGEKRGTDKGDAATLIKCVIAAMRKTLCWRAVFSSYCMKPPDFQRHLDGVALECKGRGNGSTRENPPASGIAQPDSRTVLVPEEIWNGDRSVCQNLESLRGRGAQVGSALEEAAWPRTSIYFPRLSALPNPPSPPLTFPLQLLPPCTSHGGGVGLPAGWLAEPGQSGRWALREVINMRAQRRIVQSESSEPRGNSCSALSQGPKSSSRTKLLVHMKGTVTITKGTRVWLVLVRASPQSEIDSLARASSRRLPSSLSPPVLKHAAVERACREHHTQTVHESFTTLTEAHRAFYSYTHINKEGGIGALFQGLNSVDSRARRPVPAPLGSREEDEAHIEEVLLLPQTDGIVVPRTL